MEKIMITEDYVSFETAKLLKEKGFDCLCHSYFRKDNPNNLVKVTCGANWNDTPFFTSRPTLQMAMKWLREMHKIHISTTYNYEEKTWNCDVEKTLVAYIKELVGYKTYEEACGAALKYCLKHLIFNNYDNNQILD